MRVQAQVTDATHLQLDRPVDLPAGSLILIDLIPADAQRRAWLWASMANLERAYGSHEPDYSQAGVPVDHED